MTQTINWVKFARLTIESNDLDPMYELIRNLKKTKDPAWMARFIVYFVFFYDAGGAKKFADELAQTANLFQYDREWELMKNLAWLSDTKRGTERRHFRGKNAIDALKNLHLMKMPMTEMVDDWWAPTYTQLYQKVSTKYARCQLGPYFIWKIFDIVSVGLGRHISMNLDEAVKFMPDEPRKAAAMFFPDRDFRAALGTVNDYVSGMKHPVADRYCSYPETETILCMMKGFFGTKVHAIGDDILDKHNQLKDYPELQALLPKQIPLVYTLEKPLTDQQQLYKDSGGLLGTWDE